MLVIEGFGKTYGMTGWRLGWAHGPKRLIQEMAKLQQFTFVCAPSIVQWAGVAAVDYDPSAFVADYRRKRDLLAAGLRGLYDFALPGGAFYLFPKAPWGTGTEFVTEAIKHNLLVIPGNVFSGRTRTSASRMPRPTRRCSAASMSSSAWLAAVRSARRRRKAQNNPPKPSSLVVVRGFGKRGCPLPEHGCSMMKTVTIEIPSASEALVRQLLTRRGTSGSGPSAADGTVLDACEVVVVPKGRELTKNLLSDAVARRIEAAEKGGTDPHLFVWHASQNRGRVPQFVTSVGVLSLTRRYWRCRCATGGGYAADAVVGLNRRVSKVVQRHCCRLAADVSFAKTSEHLRQMLGVGLSHETVRTLVESATGRRWRRSSRPMRRRPRRSSGPRAMWSWRSMPAR